MKIESIRIKNFRTIDSDNDNDIVIRKGLTIVGPNSSGKTNILKAIEMFFTGFENKRNYQIERDFPKGVESGQTSLSATFIIEDNEKPQLELYKALNNCLEQPKQISNIVTVYLTFTRSGNPLYRIFAGEKIKDELRPSFNSKQKDLLLFTLNSFNCHYIPSAKSIDNLYRELLLPFIKRSISKILNDKTNDINLGLNKISDVIDKQLSLAGMSNIKSHFRIPNGSLEHLLSSFEYHLSDPVTTEIEHKGMGIQSAVTLASFSWITKEESALGKSSIWLIEEPESYLHPELAGACNLILRELSDHAHVVTTTHSLSFVPQDPVNILGTEIVNGCTKLVEYDSYIKATNAIRSSLGVKFSDFCNLGHFNVMVEGKTDRELLQWALSKIDITATGKYSWDNVRRAEFLDFGGTGALEGFLKATYQYIHRERPTVTVLDGDEAGDRTRRNLQGYFNEKGIPFEANKQFVVLSKGFAIEGLFPHAWIIEANAAHPNWFKKFSVDMQGALLPFDFKNETTKNQLREHLKSRAESSKNLTWSEQFSTLFDLLEQAFEDQSRKLSMAPSETQ